MCCFRRPVSFVGSTKIFARFLDFTTQCIVYEMRLDAGEELAMILPIPVAQPAKEDAVIKGPEWQESEKNAGQFVNTILSKDTVWGGGHLYKRSIHGRQKNEDVLAAARKLG